MKLSALQICRNIRNCRGCQIRIWLSGYFEWDCGFRKDNTIFQRNQISSQTSPQKSQHLERQNFLTSREQNTNKVLTILMQFSATKSFPQLLKRLFGNCSQESESLGKSNNLIESSSCSENIFRIFRICRICTICKNCKGNRQQLD